MFIDVSSYSHKRFLHLCKYLFGTNFGDFRNKRKSTEHRSSPIAQISLSIQRLRQLVSRKINKNDQIKRSSLANPLPLLHIPKNSLKQNSDPCTVHLLHLALEIFKKKLDPHLFRTVQGHLLEQGIGLEGQPQKAPSNPIILCSDSLFQ